MITFDKTRKVQWSALLNEAVKEPGMLSEAYRAFHRFSLLNRISAIIQCSARGITPGPIASFTAWKQKGRYVKKGEKALMLCMPIFVPVRAKTDDETEEQTETVDNKGRKMRTIFEYKPNWFVLSQTEGQDAQPEPAPGFDYDHCLAELGVSKIAFDMPDGGEITDTMARRIIQTAESIIRAGMVADVTLSNQAA